MVQSGTHNKARQCAAASTLTKVRAYALIVRHCMKFRLQSLALVLATLVSETVMADVDPLCEPLVRFVNSLQPEVSQKIEFRTSWGQNFKDAKEIVLSAKRCNHFDYKSAMPLCSYLITHGATEFPDSNLKRVIQCLSQKTVIGYDVRISHASLSFFHGDEDRGSQIIIEFLEDEVVGGMLLMVQAEGY